LIERLKKKHGPSLADVLARQVALREELAALEANDERAARLETQAVEAREAFVHAAGRLSSARQAAAGALGRALVDVLAELAMPKSRVEVRVTGLDADPQKWTARGIDDVEFFLSPNPGEEVRPLARIASGGELSRVMLALRTLASTDEREEAGRTLIFDEVDAGIGGAAADAVGARLQALSRRHQVLCITHLPQIAARAQAHFQIAKQVTNGRTVTVVRRLDAAGKEQEVARMIAGAHVSAQVVASAREMIAARQDGRFPSGERSGRVSADVPEALVEGGEGRAKGESERPMRAKAKGKRSGA
jgi:DNA repair protein RecN (Recombination protein N)